MCDLEFEITRQHDLYVTRFYSGYRYIVKKWNDNYSSSEDLRFITTVVNTSISYLKQYITQNVLASNPCFV